MSGTGKKVRILPDRSVVIDGRAEGPGSEVTVPAADAETLVRDGYAELVAAPGRKRKPVREKA